MFHNNILIKNYDDDKIFLYGMIHLIIFYHDLNLMVLYELNYHNFYNIIDYNYYKKLWHHFQNIHHIFHEEYNFDLGNYYYYLNLMCLYYFVIVFDYN